VGRNVWILSSISLAVAIGYGVVAPVLPLYATEFGASAMQAAMVISAFALMRFVFSPAVGWLVGRFSHRVVLMSGLIIVALSSASAGLASSLVWLIVLRGLGGIGSAMFSISGMSVLLGSVAPNKRGRAAGLYQGGFLLGAMAGPPLGGIFAQISLRAPFFFYAGTLTVAALVALALRPVAAAALDGEAGAAEELGSGVADAGATASAPGSAGGSGSEVADAAATASAPGSAGGSGSEVADAGATASAASPAGPGARPGGDEALPLRVVARDRRFQAACLANIVHGWNSHGARAVLVPLFVAASLAASDKQAAAWTAIAMGIASGVQIVMVWPAGWLADHFGRRGPMVAGGAICAVALAATPWAGSIVVLTVALCLYAVGAALLGGAPAALVGDAAGQLKERAVAVFSMCGDAGSIVGPLVVGALADVLSFEVAFATAGTLWALSALMSLTLPRGLQLSRAGR